MSWIGRMTDYGRLVRFSHTIFALPFAVMGAVLGMRVAPGRFGWWEALWILVAMVGARTAAMTMNRLADHDIDARNPRTTARELPSGEMSRGEVWGVLLLSTAAFLLACGMLNRMTLYLSPIVLVVIFGYPYTKRFTSLCHVWLGAALGLSPVGAWVAVTGGFGEGFGAAFCLGGAVVLWTAGFDILYALHDVQFDREQGLFSIPSRFGVVPALVISAVFHAAAVALLVAAGIVAELGVVYYAGVGAISVILVVEHVIVTAKDFSRVNLAFFTMNGLVSVGLMLALLLDVWIA